MFDGISVSVHLDKECKVELSKSKNSGDFTMQIGGSGYSSVTVFADKHRLREIADRIMQALWEEELIQEAKENEPCATNA